MASNFWDTSNIPTAPGQDQWGNPFSVQAGSAPSGAGYDIFHPGNLFNPYTGQSAWGTGSFSTSPNNAPLWLGNTQFNPQYETFRFGGQAARPQYNYLSGDSTNQLVQLLAAAGVGGLTPGLMQMGGGEPNLAGGVEASPSQWFIRNTNNSSGDPLNAGLVADLLAKYGTGADSEALNVIRRDLARSSSSSGASISQNNPAPYAYASNNSTFPTVNPLLQNITQRAGNTYPVGSSWQNLAGAFNSAFSGPDTLNKLYQASPGSYTGGYGASPYNYTGNPVQNMAQRLGSTESSSPSWQNLASSFNSAFSGPNTLSNLNKGSMYDSNFSGSNLETPGTGITGPSRMSAAWNPYNNTGARMQNVGGARMNWYPKSYY